jgi:hypothetical protein
MNPSGALGAERKPATADKFQSARAVLEREAERALSAAFGGGHLWDALEYGGLLWGLFGPLRRRLQALARKYPNGGPRLAAAFYDVLQRRLLSLRRRRPGREFLARFAAVHKRLCGVVGPVAPSRSDGLYEKALRIRRSGKHQSSVTHRICRELVPGFAEMSVHERAAECRTLKEGMKRAEQREAQGRTKAEDGPGWLRALPPSKLPALSYLVGLFKSAITGSSSRADPQAVIEAVNVLAAQGRGRPLKKLTTPPS